MRAHVALEFPAARRTLASTRLWRRGDRALLLAVGTLTAFGLVMVFSASEVKGWMWIHNAAYYF
jgi:cell division protein FtsW (lipid II flippase)